MDEQEITQIQSSEFNLNSDDFVVSTYSTMESNYLAPRACEKCKQQFLVNSTLISKECPVCGKDLHDSDTTESILRPKYSLPFVITKDEISSIIDKQRTLHIRNASQKVNSISELYIPAFLISGTAYTDIACSGVIRYEEYSHHHSKFHHHSNNGTSTTTLTVPFERAGHFLLENLPISAASTIPHNSIINISPFNFSNLVPYKESYTNDCVVCASDTKDIADTAKTDIMNFAAQVFTEGENYRSVHFEKGTLSIKDKEIKYTLLPTYLIKVKNKYFLMNGQTGLAVPCSFKNAKSTFVQKITKILGVYIIIYLATIFPCIILATVLCQV